MKKIILWVIAIVVVVLIIISLSSEKSTLPTSKQPIRIGAIISLTGIAAQFGEMSKYGIDLAVKEINAEDGIDGRKVKVSFEDDRTEPQTAAGLYHKISKNVDVIIGSNFDFVTQPLLALAKTGDTVVVTPSNPRIPGAFDTNVNSFVMMSDFSKIISVFNSYLEKESFKKMAIVRFDSAFSAEIARVLNDELETLNKPSLIAEVYKQIGNNDFRTQILKLKQQGVDLVFLDMIGPDPLTFVTQSKQLGFNPKIITHVGLHDAMAIKGTDPNIFNGIVALDWNVSPQAFTDKFTQAYKIVPTNSANRAYDAVYILVDAVAHAKDKASIGTYLTSKIFTTPNGDFKFSPEHSADNTEVALLIVQNGKFVEYK